MEEEASYLPIPASAARQIAKQFQKSIVIISAWDSKFSLLHTTTYGESLEEKHHAALGGEIVSEALGANLPEKKTFEDFRLPGKLVIIDPAKFRVPGTDALAVWAVLSASEGKAMAILLGERLAAELPIDALRPVPAERLLEYAENKLMWDFS